MRGVEVVRPFATSFGKARISGRLSDYATFGASALAELVAVKRPDVIVALTTPPMIAAGAALVAATRGVPLVTWIQDVHPEATVELGLLPASHPAVSALRLVAKASHLASRRTVVLSDGMAERVVRQGQRPDRIRVVPNWIDGSAVVPMPTETSAFRREHGLGGRFVAMYSGNLGAGHDLPPFVEAARRLATLRPGFVLAFVGDGVARAALESEARELPNVRFFPYQPRERLCDSLAAADVHLASLRRGLDGLLVPSKLYGILAAGRPLVYLGPERCELSRVVHRGEVGWVVRPGDVDGLVAALLEAIDGKQDVHAMGRRARELFCAEFERTHALARWREILTDVALAG